MHPVKPQSYLVRIEEQISKKNISLSNLSLKRVECVSSDPKPMKERAIQIIVDAKCEIADDQIPVFSESIPARLENDHFDEIEWREAPGDIQAGDFVKFAPHALSELKDTIAEFHPWGFKAGLETVYKVLSTANYLYYNR